MKTFDIRKIYVCQIQEISNIFEKQIDGYVYHGGSKIYSGPTMRKVCTLNESEISYGLFIKGLTGYKHILTGTKYRLANNSCVHIGEPVINPDKIELFTKRERTLASNLVNKYQSFDIDINIIKELEDQINGNSKHIEENEEVFGK